MEKGEIAHSTPGKETPVEIKQLRYVGINTGVLELVTS
jgi:hypothetical protein